MAQTHPTISVVINTKNSGQTLRACLQSVHAWADEIIVMDMKSQDDTIEIARFFGARTFSHPDVGYVEPARNAALAKARGEWILVLDSDEEIPGTLAKHIRSTLVASQTVDAYFLPRKNLIFDKWVKTGWWPDHILRLFRKGSVVWSDELHAIPSVRGTAVHVDAKESWAITHHNYQTIEQYWSRALRYGRLRAKERQTAKESVQEPLAAFIDEYLRRFYAWDGQTDGAHGAFLSTLQGSTAVLEQALFWELKGFPRGALKLSPLQTLRSAVKQANHWTWTNHINQAPSWLRPLYKIARRLQVPAPTQS